MEIHKLLRFPRIGKSSAYNGSEFLRRHICNSCKHDADERIESSIYANTTDCIDESVCCPSCSVSAAPGKHDAAEIKKSASSVETDSGINTQNPTNPTKLIFVRHGETADTQAHVFAGGSVLGPELCEEGKKQAQRAAALVLASKEIWSVEEPDIVYCSPMKRAYETGTIIANRLGLQAEVDDRIRECEFGEWEGISVDKIVSQYPDLHQSYIDGTGKAPGGESMLDVAQRIRGLINDLTKKHQGKTVVLAAHAVVIRVAVSVITQMPPYKYACIRIPPASLTIAEVWPGLEVKVDSCISPDQFSINQVNESNSASLVNKIFPSTITTVGCPSELLEPVLL